MPRRVYRQALGAVFGVPGLSLMGSMVGFGAFAQGAGWTLFEMQLSTVLIWALPAQIILIGGLSSGASIAASLAAVSISSIRLLPMVCSVIPLLRNGRTRLWKNIIAGHFVAQTLWILSFVHMPSVEREDRMTFFAICAAFLVTGSVLFGSLGWLVAGNLPFPLAVALLMLTPASFLLLTERAARRAEEKAAIVVGLLLLPVVHHFAPMVGLGDWDLLITGLVGGSAVFGVALAIERRRPA